MRDYWSTLQLFLAVIIALTALRFVFPRAARAISVLYVVMLLLAALTPGLPTWLRVAIVCLALAAGAALVVNTRRDRALAAEPG
jgi:hypothetical protein